MSAPTRAIVNARVWTGDPRRPWADALVARDDRLVFVGSAAEARKLTRDAPDADVIDAAGRYVVANPPGVLRAGGPAAFVYVDDDPSQAPSQEPSQDPSRATVATRVDR